MSIPSSAVTAQRWRSRRSAAVGGIVFAVLLITVLVLMRVAVVDETLQDLVAHPRRQALMRTALQLVPFAGIAFLWFIGVVRDQLGDTEDRLFSSVFLGSGLLFLAMMFLGAVLATSLLRMVPGPDLGPGTWEFGRQSTVTLVTVYAMRMAAVFTATVSTVVLRTAAVHRNLAYVGYSAALVLLLAGGRYRWVELLFPAWVLVLSVAILMTPERPRADTRPG
ncbi:hypothetical protein [Cellulomonas sp. URHD0024]|uniref:hypothetical protein n=1 Tax=Cellulomonas sp. URHD0024 TaxID=1302620 RepID=UPI0004144D10|nr:hypothetical protein [Cellulomonas sp. URHD0024]